MPAPNLAEFLAKAFTTVADAARDAGAEPPASITVECRMDAMRGDLLDGSGVVRFEVDVPEGDSGGEEGVDANANAADTETPEGFQSDGLVSNPAGPVSNADLTDDELAELDAATRPDETL